MRKQLEPSVWSDQNLAENRERKNNFLTSERTGVLIFCIVAEKCIAVKRVVEGEVEVMMMK